MPKLWSETIDAHRREVRDAILTTTRQLVTKHGLRGVTMSQIAEQVGIGRATLYKYFSDVEAILVADHMEHLSAHVAHLTVLRDKPGTPIQRLEAVCERFASIRYQAAQHGRGELYAFLHQDQHIAGTMQQLQDLLRGLLAEAAKAGEVRTDISPAELAHYCVHALGAAGDLPSQAAVRRLVTLTLAALRAQP